MSVVCQCVCQSVAYDGAKLGRRDDSDLRTVGQQFCEEVVSDAHTVVEVLVFVVDHLLLGVVQRQCAEIFCLTRVCANDDVFDFAMRKYDAE